MSSRSGGARDHALGENGQYTDPETGLQYDRARYYDPQTAQFMSVDPLEELTRQSYAYVADNPINATDPSGLDETIPASVGPYAGQSWAGAGGRLDAYCQQHPSDPVLCGSGPSLCDWAAAVGSIALGGAGDLIDTLVGGEAADEGLTVAGEQATIHGAERLQQAGFDAETIATTTAGLVLRQADGATVYINEVSPGRYDFIVEGDNGVITAHRGWSYGSVTRLATNYGWEGWPP